MFTRLDRFFSRIVSAVFMVFLGASSGAAASPMLAGAAKVDITDRESIATNDPLYVKALVLRHAESTIVLVTVDAVAIGGIGRIDDQYLPRVRKRLKDELGVEPENLLVNASHCHGVVCKDVDAKTVEAVHNALNRLEPVTVGVGSGHEDRIMENRRMRLKSGQVVDVRHAYSLAPDETIAEVFSTDPEIGVLRLDRRDGTPLAVLYNFACHPIQGVPGGANTADLVGYASKVIEENLGPETMALFFQGCAGDINPVWYKDFDHPRSAEPLGTQLGLSVLRAVRQIECAADERLRIVNTRLSLPRKDHSERIAALQAKQQRLLLELQGTSLNFKSFLTLYVKQGVSPEYPSYAAHRYLHDDALGRTDLRYLDAENRKLVNQYLNNIHTMEELTRVGTNLALLRMHQQQLVDAGSRTVEVEVAGLRVGEMVLVTFPGELTVQIGMNIKLAARHEHTYVAGYTNGYIYYAPTREQLMNPGEAQEDCDSIVAPEWQEIFESHVAKLLERM